MLSFAGAVFLSRHAIVFVLFAATCFVLGRWLLRGFDLETPGEEFGFSIALGMGSAGTALFGLGLLGFLTGPVLAGGFLLVHLSGLRTWRDVLRRLRATRDPGIPRPARLPWLPAAILVLLAAALSCYPPTGFDATFYHLPYARAFAGSHRVVSLPASRFPVFPQLNETLFSAMLIAGDDTDAQRVELLAMLACFAALAGWTRRKSGAAAGAWAASAWVGCPAVALLSASAYVDSGFALFSVLSFLAWERWRDQDGRRWLAVAGILAGFAAGTKYHGIFVVALLGAATLWVSFREKRGAGPACVLAAAAIGAASPWYVRNVVATGNPVFPFLPRIFGRSPYSLSFDAVTPGGTGASDATMTLLKAAHEWLGAPMRVVLSLTGIPFRAGQTPLSPFLLPLAVIATVAGVRIPVIRRALFFAAVYAVACGGAEVRFLLPAAALVAFAGASAGAALASARRPVSVSVRAAVAAALVLPGAAWTAHRLVRLGPVPIRTEERGAFLRRELPPYAAVEFLNRSRGRDYTVYAVGAENLAYFADGNFLGDWFGPYSYSTICGHPLHDAATLSLNLERIGARYLLLNLPRLPAPIPASPQFSRYFRERLRGPGFALYERRD